VSFQIRPARREGTKLLLGLAGPSGSGKTYSALLLASGIVETTGGRVVMIDTESGRALQYAPPGDDAFEFDYLQLGPPFSPDRYREAFAAAEAHAGAGGVVIVDSTSHEHEGPGGVLEWHDAEVERRAGDDQAKAERVKFAAWGPPKAERRKLINRILQSRCHVIFCFRAKEKNTMVAKKNGRRGEQEIVSIGWQPITGDDWPYEMTIFALLNPAHKGVPIIDGFDHGKLPLNMRALVSTEVAINRDTGRKLARWAGNAGQTPAPAQPQAPRTAKSMVEVWLGPQDQRTMTLRQAYATLKRALGETNAIGRVFELRERNTAVVEAFPPPGQEGIRQAIVAARERLGDVPDDSDRPGEADDAWGEPAEAGTPEADAPAETAETTEGDGLEQAHLEFEQRMGRIEDEEWGRTGTEQ